MEHSRLSPSSMARGLLCPGSLIDNPPDTGSEAADVGTLAHAFCERILNGESVPDVDFPDSEMRQGVYAFVDYVRSYMDHFPETKLYVEIRIVSKLNPEFGGTMDVVLISPTHIHAIDFKYGVKPVSPYDNKQLLSYLSLADEKFPGRKKFFGSIVQPRVFGDPQCVEYEADKVHDHTFDVLAITHDDTRTPGEHCNWFCPLAKTCQVMQDHHNQVVLDALDDDDWDGERCKSILSIGDTVAQLVKDAKVRLTQLLSEGKIVEGWRLAQALGNRSWKDEAAVKAELEKAEVPKEVYTIEKLVSPAQLEKFSKAYKSFTDQHTERPRKGAVAVPNDSKLPDYDELAAFDVDIEDLF